uniref:Major facilitator superfamily (MFS) profile domain-containing protein n=1 Tax=Clastoptera arizonana TaxID=38151 RepID=A0A1B6DS48_9HEMI
MFNIWGLLLKFFSSLTIEPMFLLYYVSASIATLASTNLLIQKACHTGATVEPDYNTPCPDEVEAQKLVTNINVWRPTMEYTLPVIIITFLGSWSDTHGKRRKPLLLIPVIGEIVTTIFVMLSVYYWSWSPELTAVLESIFRGITGGRTCFSSGANTYISDITNVEQRTFRLGIVTAMIFVATPIGSALAGFLRMQLGFFKLFGLCMILNIFALSLGFVLMKNSTNEKSPLKFYQGMFDLSKLILSFKTLFKNRPGNKRVVLLCMAVVSPLFGACFTGEFSVIYFFLRYKFYLDEVEFGYYSAYKMLTVVFGTIISVSIFSKVFKLSDALIGCLGAITQIATALLMCFAVYKWQVYVFPLFDFMHGAIYTTSRSIVSKAVEGTELGQINCVLGTIDSLIPLIVFPTYNKFYNYTFELMPGAFFSFKCLLSNYYFHIILNYMDYRQ